MGYPSLTCSHLFSLELLKGLYYCDIIILEIQAKLVKQPASQPDNPKVLKVAIIGAPNAGKSTLVNKLLNWKVRHYFIKHMI